MRKEARPPGLSPRPPTYRPGQLGQVMSPLCASAAQCFSLGRFVCLALRVVRIKQVKPHLELHVAYGRRSCQQLCKEHGGRCSGLCANGSEGCSVRLPERRATRGSLSPPVQPPSPDAASPPTCSSSGPSLWTLWSLHSTTWCTSWKSTSAVPGPSAPQ